MRLPAATTNDTLDAASLPLTDGTELNHRTRPLPPEEENRLTRQTLFSPALLIAPVGLALSWFLPVAFGSIVLIGAALVATLLALVKFGQGRSAAGELLGLALVTFAGSLGIAFHLLPSPRFGYGVVFPVVVGGVYVFAFLVAKQAAYWMANHPKVEWATSRRWEEIFPESPSWAVPEECPEARTVWTAPLLLGVAYAIGWLALLRVEKSSLWEYAAGFGVVGFVATLALFVAAGGHTFRVSAVMNACWRAIRLWCVYNLHDTKAAGVFRFPTPMFRNADNRKKAIYLVLILLSAGVLACLPSLTPAERPDPDAPKGPYILPHEEEFLSTLSPDEARLRRRELLSQRTPRPKVAPPLITRIATAGVRGTIAAGAVIAGSYAILFAVFAVSFGRLLVRYDLALESENGYAHSETFSAWDNYVNRMVESKDHLEKEHYLLGFSVFGDYPVLLHKDILNQHYHITGDTGAAKTALGVAPLATQMVFRGDSSVVIVDLKGDMSLFETMRREAERNGREFRWFTSEPGKSSFSFNPFLQSHLTLLTPEQRTESLLQAMSLDYGLGYGKSYFTAMNEVVLKNLLKAYDIRSFKDLEGYLADPAAYHELGEKRDFEQARHLAAIVSRLAGMLPLNLGAGSGRQHEEVNARAIDAMDVLHRPQVLYFFLSSPQEPIGAPSVAKLFLWALFSAAARQPPEKNRVYVFVDEFQQIISDSVKLVFEQIRSKGVTMVVAHQTSGQLKRQGTDLMETIDSCTAVKHVFRASDLATMKRLEEASGQAVYHTLTWTQTLDPSLTEKELPEQLGHGQAADGLVGVSELIGPRLDRNTIIRLSANPLASFVRFTSANGYTQFAGFTTPILSSYIMSKTTYDKRDKAAWPADTPGTVLVPFPSESIAQRLTEGPKDEADEDDWDDRLRRGMLS
ncbi:MAG: type IV secretion system DNA-binding domain-containing protein [Gemmataceae bacterium]|nr:type IV secretion system DNA-binding domain-containing protein [Gemmataceae bacterium]